MRKNKYKVKEGAASFYIVAFSTLILVIIAASFAAVIISEITRTSNDDLAQSAYDSALAGVEDAKLAFYNYRNCKNSGATATELDNNGDLSCGEIIWLFEESDDCDMVGRVLGRYGSESGSTVNAGGEVLIQESSSAGNNMQQAYTCVKVETEVGDYRSNLSSSNQIKVIKANFADGISASDIDRIKISWYSDSDGTNYRYKNFQSNKVVFPSLTMGSAAPPTISVAMIQTAEMFNLTDFETTNKDDQTDRGMVYLVPAGAATSSGDEEIRNKLISEYGDETVEGNNYISAYNGINNSISTKGFLKSNNKKTKNLPYAVYCPENSGAEFACEATIKLPQPVGGNRNDDTFVFIVSLPYSKPDTSFALQFLCGRNDCGTQTVIAEDGTVTEEPTNIANLDGVQISVDSTGRANDLFRRVEVRLEGADASSLSVLGPIELLGDSDKVLLDKDYAVTTEYNF